MRDVKFDSEYDDAYWTTYYTSQPNFCDRVIFNDCVAIEMSRC